MNLCYRDAARDGVVGGCTVVVVPSAHVMVMQVHGGGRGRGGVCGGGIHGLGFGIAHAGD